MLAPVKHLRHQFCHRNSAYLKARSHDPISKIRFLIPKIGRRRSYGPISRFRFCRHLSSFKTCIGQKQHVLFPSFFKKHYGSVCWKVIFTVFTRSHFRNQQNRIFEIGSCERAFRAVMLNQLFSNLYKNVHHLHPV